MERFQIGIIGAMDVEVELLKGALADARTERVAGQEYCAGRLGEKDVVVVKCGVGKVNAGICAQVLADHFGSYIPAYALFAGCLVCSMVLIQGVYHKMGVGKRPSNR